VTKAQEIYDQVNELVASGTEKSDAFRQLAEAASRPYDSIRGSYYSHKKKVEGGEGRPSRTRRRETTPEDALADARASLERSIASIDREVETAKTRAKEAAAEYEAIRGSAEERKKTITERLEALK
jgi:predicted  nucleic acid-binding Zn-ribbon protein